MDMGITKTDARRILALNLLDSYNVDGVNGIAATLSEWETVGKFTTELATLANLDDCTDEGYAEYRKVIAEVKRIAKR